MPIEDVDFLKANSVRQSYTFLVDSADRDRSVYPSPANYVVEFTTPFHNVVGFDVVHASIPRTMYNIDVINNKITFYIYEDPATLTSYANKVTVEISVGEYTIQTLVVALTNVLKMHLDNDPSKPIIGITAESTTNPPDVESKLRFRCAYPFFIDMNASTVAESLGFDEYTQLTERSVPALKRRYENPFPSINRKFYHSVDIDPSEALGADRVVFEGPRGVIRKVNIGPTTFVAQRFRLQAAGYLRQVFAALWAADVSVNDVAVWEIRTSLDMSVPPLMTSTIAVSYIDGTLSDSSDDVRVKLEAMRDYWIVFRTTESQDMAMYYNDVLDDTTTMKTSNDGGQTWSTFDNSGVFFNVSLRIVVADEYHVLTAPGIYSLIGPKYIVLRCEEIEEHSFRSLAFSKYHLGLGMFKLGVVGYSENRMDFNKVPLREFHPIGKLRRLTLRFELPSGELYDFKGVNHNVTFAIHYMEPVQKLQFQTSILNPNYNGNFINYMYSQTDQEGESDDEGDEDFNRDRLADYRQQEAYYLPENRARREADFVHTMRHEFDDEVDDDDDDDA